MKGRAVDKLDAGVAVVLYGVSTWFSIKLFREMAGDQIKDWLPFVLLAMGFEGARAVLWIRGNLEKNLAFIAVALGLTVLSLTASTGNVLATMEKAGSGEKVSAYAIEADKATVERLEKQIEVETKRLEAMPPEYVSAARTVRESIEKKEVQRQEILQRIEDREKTKTGDTEEAGALFTSVAKVMKLSEVGAERFKLAFLLAIAGATEVSCLMLSKASLRKKDEIQGESSGEVEREDGERALQPEPGDQGSGEPLRESEKELSTAERIASCLFPDGQYPRGAAFPSEARARKAGVEKVQYDDIVHRGLMSGMLRRSSGRLFLSKGVRKDEFVKEVESWPE